MGKQFEFGGSGRRGTARRFSAHPLVPVPVEQLVDIIHDGSLSNSSCLRVIESGMQRIRSSGSPKMMIGFAFRENPDDASISEFRK